MAKFNDNDVFTVIKTENIYEGEIDQELSPTSTNPVENRVITNEINKIKNGNTPVGKSLVTKQIENVSENSGSTQTDPFINQATGTKNNTISTPVSPVAKHLEKRANSVVYNQKVQNGNFASNSGWTANNASISIGNNIATLVQTNSSDLFGLTAASFETLDTSHKLLFIINAKCDHNIQMRIRYPYISGYQNITTSYNNLYFLRTTESMGNNGYFYIQFSDNSYTNTVDIKSIVCIDLTQWYGSNDEIPSYLLEHPEYFTNLYNGDYHYSTGEILDSDGAVLESVEFNQWNEEWELGDLNAQTGGAYPDTTRIRSKYDDPIRVTPDTDYYFRTSSSYTGNVFITTYDNNGNYLGYARSYNGAVNHIFHTPSNCAYIRFSLQATYGTTYNHDININLSWDGERDGEYKPFKKHTYNVPALNKPYSINKNVFNKLTPDGTETDVVDRIKLKDLNWVSTVAPNVFSCAFGNFSGNSLNARCNLYNNIGIQDYTNMVDKTIQVRTNTIYVKDTTYSDATTFKNHFTDDDYLYYELAEPIITQDDSKIFANEVEDDDYGTMGWKDENGNYVVIPQGCKLFYPADLVLTLDDLNNLTDGDVSKLALKTDIPTIPTVTDLSNDVTNITDLTPINIAVMNIDGFITINMLLSNSGNTIQSGTTLFTLDSTDLAILTYIHVLPAILYDGNGDGYNIMLNVDSSGNVTASQDIPIQTILTINFTY